MLWYLDLEPVTGRYTQQLCERWMPDIFERHSIEHTTIKGIQSNTSISVGVVLDAAGRGIYSLTQCAEVLRLISEKNIRSNDIIYIQDFWTPGLEAVFYALDLYNIHPRIYAMVHAQTVDVYDFTYPMRSWMRPIEMGYASRMSGVFVASSIHRELLKAAGWEMPIHVTGLAIDYKEVSNRIPITEKDNTVVFSSRLDKEKQPLFMIDVAKRFLRDHADWRWIVTTSQGKLRSNDRRILDALENYAAKEPRFQIQMNSKQEYYELLGKSAIQFNCSLQDFVSWTLLEASIAGCDVVYPNYRSFPECVAYNRLYFAWDAENAAQVLHKAVIDRDTHERIALTCDQGRHLQAQIMADDVTEEQNVWMM